MYIDYYKSPVGLIQIEATDKYLGKCFFVKEKGIASKSNTITDQAKKYFLAYFNKENPTFPSQLINFGDDFSNKVYQTIFNQVKHGTTITYKELGKLMNSHAYRAIGTALSRNKIVLIIPCHRVIRSDGTIGNYTYFSSVQVNSSIKKYLIEHEQ